MGVFYKRMIILCLLHLVVLKLLSQFLLKRIIINHNVLKQTGLAGIFAKTAVAPLDRVKILLQAHNQHYKHLGGFYLYYDMGLVHLIKQLSTF